MSPVARSSRVVAALAVAALFVAGIVPVTGCSREQPQPPGVSATAARPSLDATAPAELSTATFGMG